MFSICYLMLCCVMLCYVMLCYACMYLYIYMYVLIHIHMCRYTRYVIVTRIHCWNISQVKDLWKKLKYAARKVVSGLMKAKEFLFGSSDGAVGRATVDPRAYIYIYIYIYYILYILYIYTYNTCRHVHVCQCRVHKLKLLLCAAIRFRCCPVPNCFEAAKDSATRRKKFGMEWKNASPRTSRWRKRQKIMAPACWKPSLDSR